MVENNLRNLRDLRDKLSVSIRVYPWSNHLRDLRDLRDESLRFLILLYLDGSLTLLELHAEPQFDGTESVQEGRE